MSRHHRDEYEPPEPAPDSPKWLTPAEWDSQVGLWVRCGGIVITDATRANWHRYLDAKKARQEREQAREEARKPRRKMQPTSTPTSAEQPPLFLVPDAPSYRA